jgi:membrane-associated protein
VGAIKHLLEFLKPEALISWGGFTVIPLVVFAETGLLAGFFLPGDSLLFVAGFLIGSGALKPPAPLPQDPIGGLITLQILLIAAGFIGNSTGYWVGSKAGPALFNRPNSRFFKKEHLERTHALYEEHGGKIIIMAEFMPFARTFAPVVAGIGQMPYRRFMTYNIIGIVVWIISMTTLGMLLGQVDIVRKNLEKAIILVIALSVLPAIIHIVKERNKPKGEPADS